MARVWGYDLGLNDFALFDSEAAWEKQTTEETAQGYLRNHLREQLTREIPVANDAFVQESVRTQIGLGFCQFLKRMIYIHIRIFYRKQIIGGTSQLRTYFSQMLYIDLRGRTI